MTLKKFFFINFYYIMSKTLINSEWRAGTGSFKEFTQKGVTTNNTRVLGKNPHNEVAIIWRCRRSNSNFGINGGFIRKSILINSKNTYRLSVWIKRNSASGKTYFGCNPGTTEKFSGNNIPNPYFFIGDLPKNNKWYLLVAFLHPEDYTGPKDPETGIYSTDGKKVKQMRNFRIKKDSTNQSIRVLFFDVSEEEKDSSVQTIWDPRFELVDGNELSLPLLFTGLIAKLLVDSANTKLLSLSNIYRLAKSAIVSLVMLDGSSGFVASGFFISKDGYIVTCAHCVLKDTFDKNNFDNKVGAWSKFDKIYATVYDIDGTEESKILLCDVIGFDAAADVALLKPQNSNNWSNQTHFSWGNSRNSPIGNDCYVVGNPGGIDDCSVSKGIIRDNKYGGEEMSLIESILTDSTGVGGNSGGAVLDVNGKVIAVYGFGYGESGNLGGGTSQFIAQPIVDAIIAWHKDGSPQRTDYGPKKDKPTYPINVVHNKIDNNGEYIKGFLGVEQVLQMNGFIIDYLNQVHQSNYCNNLGIIAWLIQDNSLVNEDDIIIEIDGQKIGKNTGCNISSILWQKRPRDSINIKKYVASDKYTVLKSVDVTLLHYDPFLDVPLSSSSNLPKRNYKSINSKNTKYMLKK